jgi:hypothetical protein
MKRRTLTHPDVYRQSLLNGFTTCARRTKFDLLAGDDATVGWVGHSGQLGTALHAVAREILRTLYRQGETQMPTQEAIEVMYETVARLPFALPFQALDDLRWLTLAFAGLKWQPDGLVVIDLKTGRGRPKGPRVEPEQGEVVEGREYVSDMFQGETYSLLGLRSYPAAQRVIFREFWLRSGQIRQMTLGRAELEHVERRLAVTMMLVDRAISEGEKSKLWDPRPGSHCTRQCPVSRSCPVPREMRGDGGIVTEAQAHAAARAFAVLGGQREALRKQLYAWVEDPENPVPAVNDREVVDWNPPLGKGRRFGIWPAEREGVAS